MPAAAEATIDDVTEALRANLHFLKVLRGAAREAPGRLRDVKQWQADRLESTYDDILEEPRYHAATEFFLKDLYGPKDFSARDDAMMRIVPVMARLLPASAVETAALAVELEALTEDLDHKLAEALRDKPLDEKSYAAAYRASSTRAERERQVQLIDAVGRRLDDLVRKPFIFRTLQLMRTPARMAGLADLQDFLERGFTAFRGMNGAERFLRLLRERETEILNRLFSGSARPFAV